MGRAASWNRNTRARDHGRMASAGLIRGDILRPALLGEGRYPVDVPQVTAALGATNNPTIWIHECGRIQVRINPPEGGRRRDVWIDWTKGTVTVDAEVDTTAGAED